MSPGILSQLAIYSMEILLCNQAFDRLNVPRCLDSILMVLSQILFPVLQHLFI